MRDQLQTKINGFIPIAGVKQGLGW